MTPPATWYNEIDSTNAEARRRAEAGEGGPLWIAARLQTAGRGRRGRAWETPTGNLAATWLGVTRKSPAEAAQVSFVAALAAGDLAASYVPSSLVRLKWPNDPMVDGRKVGGILVESGKRDDGALWLACGIGVNLAHAPVQVERPATTLGAHLSAEHATPPKPERALEQLAAAFDRWAAVWERDGFDPVRAAWTERAAGLGAPCEARLGTETVHGVAEALEADGALRLRLASGEVRRITAGDVFFG